MVLAMSPLCPALHVCLGCISHPLMSTSEEVWRAESSVQPWGCCLRQICGGALKIQGVLG